MHVEQGLGARQVELAHLTFERGVVTIGERAHDALARYGLTAPHHANFALTVHRHGNRATQGHLVRLVTTHHGVFHAEVRHRDIATWVTNHAHATLGQMRCELVVGDDAFSKVKR